MAIATELKAMKRMRAGKGAARATRRDGQVPAVIYGGKEPPAPISLPYADITKRIMAGHFLSTVITLDVDGEKVRVIPRDYQLDVVKDTPVHVDFLRVTEGARIRVEVPVHFKNQDQSPGIKLGGLINLVTHAIEVLCPPDAIPQEFVVDLAGKNIGDSIHFKDITLPEGVTPTVRGDFTIASIAPPGRGSADAKAAAAAS